MRWGEAKNGRGGGRVAPLQIRVSIDCKKLL